MVKFVWLDVAGGEVPVNPEQVCYLKQNAVGQTVLVFGAVQGGLHELAVGGGGREVAAALEGDQTALTALSAPTASAAPKTPPGGRRGRRAGRRPPDTPAHP